MQYPLLLASFYQGAEATFVPDFMVGPDPCAALMPKPRPCCQVLGSSPEAVRLVVLMYVRFPFVPAE